MVRACAVATCAEPQERLVDTSAGVALVGADHPDHEATFAALAGRRLGLAGHAALEAFPPSHPGAAPAGRRGPAPGDEFSGHSLPVGPCHPNPPGPAGTA
ncbi:MAG: hypothetical protein ACRDY5_04775, partial [Acidimicrobiales bacterium]